MASNQEGKESPRMTQKQNLSLSPYRRKCTTKEGLGPDEQSIHPESYAALFFKFPPAAPVALLRRIGVKELSGVGKVKVMLKISSGDGSRFFTVDKGKKQITLIDPSAPPLFVEDCRPTIAAPKKFTYDAIFTEEDSQMEICSSALTDVIHAVINGMDGCLFCFGQAGVGKTYTMLGTTEASSTMGAIPCAIAWLFRGIHEQRQKTGTRFSVRVSCLELTPDQQELRDLLVTHVNDSEHSPLLYVRDDPLFGTLQLQQHSELRAPTAERAAFYLDAAAGARQQNTHMLYTLHVYQYSIAGKGGVAGGRSRLHLIDIGNLERSKLFGGISLTGLGNILLAIFNGHKHMPYKEHKLAQLLKECLGPLTCYATMIAHVSPNIRQYSETLTTCQFASRIHRMRRKRIRFISTGTQNNGSGGSSEEETVNLNSEYDPSSSDLSADTVIYVGPSPDDATDGEHPPVYIPNFHSNDNRCIIGKVLRGSLAEKPVRIQEEPSPTHKGTKILKSFGHIAANQTSLARSTTPKTCPARKISLKIPTSKITDLPMSKIPMLITSSFSDEQWIDGPRISKSKVVEARHMLKDTTHKKETWIDGPMQPTTNVQSYLHTQKYYGFMDNHKRSMIRKWVENQSSQIQQSKYDSTSCTPQTMDIKVTTSLTYFKDLTTFKTCHNSISGDYDMSLSIAESDNLNINNLEHITDKIGTKVNIVNIKSNMNSGLNLTNSPLIVSLKRISRTLDMLEDEDEDEEIIVPPPLPLIQPLSNGVSREVSTDSLNMSHKDIISLQPFRQSLLSEDEIFETIEVNDGQPISVQDLCLQVTEEDIAFGMRKIPISDSGKNEHPLNILSQENLATVSTFADSLSILSEAKQYVSHFSPHVGTGIPFRPYFDHKDILEQENRQKFDQLARLHKLYQSKLALANVTNSLTYQREKISGTNVQKSEALSTTEAFHSPSHRQSLSYMDVPFNDVASNHDSIYSEPAYVTDNSEQGKICDNCRQSMMRSATAFFWYPSSISTLDSPRRYCSRFGECNISNLRHPDGASNPNIKEEIERIPGNGASGSDPEEEYIKDKKLSISTATSTNTTFFQSANEKVITGKFDKQEKIKFPSFKISSPISKITPFSLSSSDRMQTKFLNLGSSLRLNKNNYDSGTDSTSCAVKLSADALCKNRADSFGYDSVLRNSETSRKSNDSWKQTSNLQEHHNGALGVLTSTLCGCFSSGTTGRVRTPSSDQSNSYGHTRIQHQKREDAGQITTNTHTIAWHNVQE